MGAIADAIYFIIDKLTDKISDYIKYKDLEKRLNDKIDIQ